MAKAKHTLSLDVQGDLFTKECLKCGIVKDWSDFHRRPDNGKLNNHCKACRGAAHKIYISENKERFDAYHEQYRTINRERSLANQMAAYARNRDAEVAKAAKYRQAHIEKIRERQRAAYTANPEKYREARRAAYRQDPSKQKTLSRKWQVANKAKVNAYCAYRDAAKLEATPQWANKEKIEEFYFAADFLSMVTGEWYHVDHVVPLLGPIMKSGPYQGERLVRGLHCEANLEVIPGKENVSKKNLYWPDMP